MQLDDDRVSIVGREKIVALDGGGEGEFRGLLSSLRNQIKSHLCLFFLPISLFPL